MLPFRTWAGLIRSLRIYRLDPAHARALDAMHRRFVTSGDLVFDVGAHVGDRVASFRRLGARVVAVEPQPGAVAVLRLLHGRDPGVTIVPMACGTAEGEARMRVNSANPTVSTLSLPFVAAASQAEGWSNQVWDSAVSVHTTTLDALILRFGEPAFVKIDVEGFEADALAGLSRPLPALSFEFTTLQRDVAAAALERLAALGHWRFNASLGETQALVWETWEGAERMRRYLEDLPAAANSGDIYAVPAARIDDRLMFRQPGSGPT